jgi:hypothetical protein
MNYKKSTGLYIFALLGGLVATICDGIHVHTRTLAYNKPFLFGQAWWVFPLFVLTFLFMGFAYLYICDHLTPNIPRQKSVSMGNSREFIETVTVFSLIYLLSGFGNFEPILLSVIFYGIFAVRWFFSYDRSWLLILSVSMAIGGMFAEGVISSAGMVTYRHVDVFYVPLWLGALYMHGAFALREGMRYFVYDSKEAL